MTFRRIWLVGLCSGVARWLELLSVGVYVYEVTGSALITTAFALLRMLPLALLGAVTGAVTDRIGHRATLVYSLLAVSAYGVALAGIAVSGSLELWHLGAGAILGGIYWTTDLPARRNLMATIAGQHRVAAAMSLDAATSNVTRAAGPALGGILLAQVGIAGALTLSASLYAVALAMVVLARKAPEGDAPETSAATILRNMIDGINAALRDRTVVGTLAVTVIFNVWAWPYTALIPVVGRDVLGLGPFPVGVLMSAEGIGALIGAIAAGFANRHAIFRKIYVGGNALCMTSVIVLALTTEPIVAGAAVLTAGFGAGGFAAMQATLIYLQSPPALRSRMLGVLSVCIGTAPIGYIHLGILADWLGTSQALMLMGVEGLVLLALSWLYWPEIR
jgi:MFS family permease